MYCSLTMVTIVLVKATITILATPSRQGVMFTASPASVTTIATTAPFQSGVKEDCQPSVKKILKPDKKVIDLTRHYDYPPKLICKWFFTAPENTLIQISVQGMYDIESALPGSYLVALDGKDDTSMVLHNFTTESRSYQWWVTSGRFLLVKYASHREHYAWGFKMRYRFATNIEACTEEDGEFYNTIDYLKSPFFGDLYPNNQVCKWYLRYYVAIYHKFQFNVLDLAIGDEIVLDDKIRITNHYPNRSLLTNKWITLCYWQCKVLFKSDYQFTGRGFDIVVGYHPSAIIGYYCNRFSDRINIISHDRRPITSPFYPDYYPPMQKCTWLLKARINATVGFMFNDFGLGPDDYLELRDGETKTANLLRSFNIYSQPKLGNWWVASGRQVWMQFESNLNFTFRGFNMTIKFLEKPKECSPSIVSLINVSNSNLSPFEPFYLNNLQCTWLITAPQHQIIKFWFTEFDLARPGDYLEMRDGVNDSAVMINNFTAKPDRINERWASSGNYLWIRFRSDNDSVGKGFNLKWKFSNKSLGCSSSSPEMVTTDKKPIESPFYPEYYTNSQQCTWIVKAPPGQRVVFMLTKVNLAQGDYLEIRDGKDKNAVVLKNISSDAYLPNVYINFREFLKSTGKFLWVRFKTDSCYVGEGFRINFLFQAKPMSIPELDLSSPSPSTFAKSTMFPIPKKPDTNLQEDSGTSSMTLVGVGVALSAFVIIVAITLLVLIRLRGKSNSNRALLNNDSWEIDISQVELLVEIGQGAFGKVWKGRIDIKAFEGDQAATSSSSPDSNNVKDMIVAVKTIHEEASEQEQREFLSEIEMMKNVGYHRNIIGMVACCTKADRVFLVVEFAELGDLLHLLKDKQKKTYVNFFPSSASAPSIPNEAGEEKMTGDLEHLLEEFSSFAWQIAQGMEYLSSKGIVHRDLAARNILVGDGLVAKVADFGLSRNVTYEDRIYQAMSRRRLPLRWMSPEALTDQIFTSKSDVWSYGVVLWEIYSMGKLPYYTLNNEQLHHFLKKGKRMKKPDLCPDEIYDLMLNCWNEHAQDRPSFSDVIEVIEKIKTRDKPYVELLQMTEGDDGYKVPTDDSDEVDSNVSDMV